MAHFINHYRHDECEATWESAWSCACNDECPMCGAEIEPHHSEQTLFDFEIELPGFIGDGDHDHLILWVSAPSEEALREVIGDYPFVCELTLCPDEDDIDFALPDDAGALMFRIQEAMNSTRNPHPLRQVTPPE